ncbi:hypothetical protein KR038_011363, partial [Drosophila bunnanda]
MAWGKGSIYLGLKERHSGDTHLLKADEVEKDLALNTIIDAAQELTLDESEDEKNLNFVVNQWSGVEFGTQDPQGAESKSK